MPSQSDLSHRSNPDQYPSTVSVLLCGPGEGYRCGPAEELSQVGDCGVIQNSESSRDLL